MNTQKAMTGEPDIVIEGDFKGWPGGARALIRAYPAAPRERPFRGAFWFGGQLEDGSEIWFRITSEAIQQMREKSPTERGARLVHALIAWLGDHAGHQLEAASGFDVYVSETGDTRVELDDG